MRRIRIERGFSRAGNLLAGAAVAVLSVSAVSGARAADEATASTANEGGLQEIVITAQRRNEREQDVPISISTVTGPALEQKGIAAVAELPQAVPSLRIDYAGNTVQPSIRGVGSQVAGPGECKTRGAVL